MKNNVCGGEKLSVNRDNDFYTRVRNKFVAFLGVVVVQLRHRLSLSRDCTLMRIIKRFLSSGDLISERNPLPCADRPAPAYPKNDRVKGHRRYDTVYFAYITSASPAHAFSRGVTAVGSVGQ